MQFFITKVFIWTLKYLLFLIFMVENTADGYRSLKMHINYGCKRFLLKKFAITFDTIQSHSVEMYYFSSKKWAKILQEKGGACFSSRRRSGLNLQHSIEKTRGKLLTSYMENFKTIQVKFFLELLKFCELRYFFSISDSTIHPGVLPTFAKNQSYLQLPDHR